MEAHAETRASTYRSGRAGWVSIVRDVLVDQNCALWYGGWVLEDPQLGYFGAREDLQVTRAHIYTSLNCVGADLHETIKLFSDGLDTFCNSYGVMKHGIVGIDFVCVLEGDGRQWYQMGGGSRRYAESEYLRRSAGI